MHEFSVGTTFSPIICRAAGQGDGWSCRGIPIDFLHAPSAAKPKKNASQEDWKEYREQQAQMKVSTLATNRLRELRTEIINRRIVCAVDGGFTNQTLFRDVPDDTILIGRIRKDARLYQVPEKNDISRRGRKRFYGNPLPTPEKIRQDESIPWQEVEAFAAGKRHVFDVKTFPKVRWRGTGDKDARLVVIRPLAYRPRKGGRLLYRNPAYLLCTDSELPLASLLQAYLWRWEIELNFRDEKTVMGAGEAQIRKSAAVETVPALVVASYAYLLLAGTSAETESVILPRPKWHRRQAEERRTTQEMIALFRTQLWRKGLENNLRYFALSNRKNTNSVFCQNSLENAILYARK